MCFNRNGQDNASAMCNKDSLQRNGLHAVNNDDDIASAEAMEECLQVFVMMVGSALREKKRLENMTILYTLLRKFDDINKLLHNNLIVDMFKVTSVDNIQAGMPPLSRIYQRQLSLYPQLLGTDAICSLIERCFHHLECHHIVSSSGAISTASQVHYNNINCIIADMRFKLVLSVHIQAIAILSSYVESELQENTENESSNVNSRGEDINLTYAYEEGSNPEEFFVPYVWAIAVR
jgi:transcription elongation factor Elf1